MSGLAAKKTCYSSRGPSFGAQHPYQVAHNYLLLQLQGIQYLWSPHANVCMYVTIKYKNINESVSRNRWSHTHEGISIVFVWWRWRLHSNLGTGTFLLLDLTLAVLTIKLLGPAFRWPSQLEVFHTDVASYFFYNMCCRLNSVPLEITSSTFTYWGISSSFMQTTLFIFSVFGTVTHYRHSATVTLSKNRGRVD